MRICESPVELLPAKKTLFTQNKKRGGSDYKYFPWICKVILFDFKDPISSGITATLLIAPEKTESLSKKGMRASVSDGRLKQRAEEPTNQYEQLYFPRSVRKQVLSTDL
jgi:hypothetical protein